MRGPRARGGAESGARRRLSLRCFRPLRLRQIRQIRLCALSSSTCLRLRLSGSPGRFETLLLLLCGLLHGQTVRRLLCRHKLRLQMPRERACQLRQPALA